MAGDIFLLGTHSWQIRRIEAGVVRVRDAGDAPPTVPFWRGEAPARTAELSEEVSQLRARVDEFLAARRPDGARGVADARLAGLDVRRGDDDRRLHRVRPRRARRDADARDARRSSGSSTTPAGCSSSSTRRTAAAINRAFGLALRKKFCRTFNFELQAAASDDAIVLSLGPHHSFPLDEVARYVNSHTVEETLQQAVLDAPMFISRWRWNLNRALLVLRFRGGRRNPPPIQRMEADDLMAAMFPQAAACQDNRGRADRDPRPRDRAPDDRRHAARSARRRRPACACSSAIEAGDVRVHTRRHDRAVGARARDPHRAAVRVPRRRGVPEPAHERGAACGAGSAVDLAAIGQLDPDAIARGARGDHAAAGDERRPARPPVLARARAAARRSGPRCGASSSPTAGRCASSDDGGSGARPRWSPTPSARSRATTTSAIALGPRPPRARRHHDRRRDRGRDGV